MFTDREKVTHTSPPCKMHRWAQKRFIFSRMITECSIGWSIECLIISTSVILCMMSWSIVCTSTTRGHNMVIIKMNCWHLHVRTRVAAILLLRTSGWNKCISMYLGQCCRHSFLNFIECHCFFLRLLVCFFNPNWP